jgi:hypothetical protein
VLSEEESGVLSCSLGLVAKYMLRCVKDSVQGVERKRERRSKEEDLRTYLRL